MKEALLYEKLDKGFVHCYLCSHHCRIPDKKFGICGVRQNAGGVLITHSYAKVVACHVDPIEKKPLYHFLPGSLSFSLATIGCNFHCGFCQNWQISQSRVKQKDAPGEIFSPEEAVRQALENKCQSISYTYTEPTIFFEYALEIARLARGKGLANIFVTNGYMTRECLLMLRPCLDAANVDLKFFTEDSYKRVCGGSLAPVLDSIRLMHELGIWVEITTLIVPGENDNEEELTGLAQFIAGVDKNIPWHISRFHPDYKFSDHGPTPEPTLEKAQRIGKACGLTYTYVGNVYGWGSDTFCPSCAQLLVKREMFDIVENKIQQGRCSFCQAPVAGIFSRKKGAHEDK